MEHTFPLPLDEALGPVTAQVWDAIRQLPQLSNQLYNGDSSAPIVVQTSQEDLARIREQTIPGVDRHVEEVVREAIDIFTHRVNVNHPRFISAISAPASSVSWLGDVLTSAFNAFGGVWEASPALATVEITLIAWLAAQVGLPPSAGGTFISGGSNANLTAVVVARDQRLKEDERSRGVAYYSDQAHFSVPKVLRIMGLVQSQMRKIPTNETFRMDMIELEKTIIADKEQGLIPFLVVANFGTTNTGAIDPLNEIADLAKVHGMWLHVDGAYGASVALSKSYRHLASGLERVDSFVWDAHKWLFQTYGCAMVFVRDKIHLSQSYNETGEYFRDLITDDDQTPDLYNYGVELTRLARHMRLWFTLRVLGLDTVGRMIDHGFILAAIAEQELRKLPNWEITSPVTLSIVTFRYCPKGLESNTVDKLNTAISIGAIQRTLALIHTTQLRGRISLRICGINPQMSISDMQEVIKGLHNIACNLVLG